MKKHIAIIACVTMAMLAGPDDSLFARGGGRGGGSRGGGGGFSGGGGSVRYSGSSFGGSGSGAAFARPSTPAPRPANPSVSQRPSNYGSMLNKPTQPIEKPTGGGIHTGETPRGNEWAAYRGPGGGGGFAVEGSGGTTVGGVRGPAGGTAVGVKGPEGGSAVAVEGPRGGTAVGVKGPEGGSAAAIRGPGGTVAAGVSGSGGYSAAAVRGPGGYWMAGVSGPAGGAAVAAKGPHGYQSYVRLPEGANYVHWHGGAYWNVGPLWYRPYYYAGTVYYSLVEPPTGYAVVVLPDGCTRVVIAGIVYFYFQNTYYLPQGDKYVVVADPTADPARKAVPDPQAMSQIQRMANFLATVKAAQVTIRDTSDEILDSGQKIQVESTRELAVRTPNRLAVDFTADGVSRRTVYDGKTITIYEKDKNLYARQPMPPTLPETMDVLASRYGMSVPAAELLRPGLLEKLKPQIRTAEYLGKMPVDGVMCHGVSLGLDWADIQIWIQDGEKALPRKASITYTKIPSTPKYVMAFKAWDLTDPADRAFEMNLPADAKQIEMTPMTEKDNS